MDDRAKTSRSRNLLAAATLLGLLTLSVYLPVGGYRFVHYDDPREVTANPHVRDGLTREGLVWAFTSASQSAVWQPVTWLSHMATVEWFGMVPGWHHRVSALVHVLNSVLLFLVLHGMTGELRKSWFVAALFGVHPLHVESVAWVSERKDVLSAFFGFLTIGAYARYAGSPSTPRYLAVVVLFALGLMAKSMLVTVPFLLLLLDGWPLGRFPALGEPPAGPAPVGRPAGVSRLVLEKIPLLALSGAMCAITYWAQNRGGAVHSLDSIPPGARISNALGSYVTYLGKTVWPSSLAVFYPHPFLVGERVPLWKPLGSLLLLGILTAGALSQRRRRPCIPVGWFWFLGMLVPVIGLVQSGHQSMADRYTYLPSIGLFLVAAWGVPDRFAALRLPRPALVALGGAVLLALSVSARFQAGHWEDNRTLWEHALRVTEKNYVGHTHLGIEFLEAGKGEEAAFHFREALRIRPGYPWAHNALGILLLREGNLEGAVDQYREAVRGEPGNRMFRENLEEALRLRERDRGVRRDPPTVSAAEGRGSSPGTRR